MLPQSSGVGNILTSRCTPKGIRSIGGSAGSVQRLDPVGWPVSGRSKLKTSTGRETI